MLILTGHKIIAYSRDVCLIQDFIWCLFAAKKNIHGGDKLFSFKTQKINCRKSG